MVQVKQKEIRINEVFIPVIEEGGEIWYPISYMGSKVLLKSLTGNQLIENGYGEYIKMFEVDFRKVVNTQGTQNTYCISEEGLKIVLNGSKIGRLSVEQKKVMKSVCKYIGLIINIDTEEQFLDNYEEELWRQYDFWSVECIEALLKAEPNIKWQRCTKCGRYYPYHKCFFGKESNPKNKSSFKTVCNGCYKSTRIIYYNDKVLTNTYYEDGEEWYKFLKNKNRNIYDIYEYYLNNNIKYPKILKNSLLVGNIINKYYKEDILNNMDIVDENFISNISKIPVNYITMKMVSKNIIESTKRKELLSSINVTKKIEDVKLKSIVKEIRSITYEEAVEVLNNYLQNNNIILTDIYNYDYSKLLQKNKVKYYLSQNGIDSLEFMVKYFNWEYAPYKFKTVGTKFWNKRDNADKTLKYLIEKDMKLQIEKIPLYITKNNLQRKCRTLYEILHKKRFDNSLFEWVNRLYLDKFIKEDFEVGVIRNEFDSMEEKMIHDMLKQNFNNVIYNNRQSENKITIMGMNPDWFIFTDNDIYIIEYFGIALYHGRYNKRISDYIDKTEEKIEKYKNLNYGKKIYLFPEDIKGECIGFYEKIKEIQ